MCAGMLNANVYTFNFCQVGRGVAHDEYIEFEIEDNKILYQVKKMIDFFEN